jgi:hypothetical protein
MCVPIAPLPTPGSLKQGLAKISGAQQTTATTGGQSDYMACRLSIRPVVCETLFSIPNTNTNVGCALRNRVILATSPSIHVGQDERRFHQLRAPQNTGDNFIYASKTVI